MSLASQEGGYHFIPLNTHLTAHELAAIMEHSGAKVLVIGERFAPLLAGLDTTALGLEVLAVGHIDGVPSLAEARAAHPRTEPTDRSPGGLFVYTSGTTGKPKGIRRPIPDGDVGQVANAAAVFGARSTSDRSRGRCSCRPACSTAARTATTWAACTSATRW